VIRTYCITKTGVYLFLTDCDKRKLNETSSLSYDEYLFSCFSNLTCLFACHRGGNIAVFILLLYRVWRENTLKWEGERN